ncbi:RimJ/RimL family protein N-acetyltransferase [Rhizobium sp. ERR 1071]|uniref:GNAT family N-acetyltransferase n=1 Tax=Rhizobium sp. ERR 1071 TaxID=2572677 RepID=UPI00119B5FF0|nr:GNAT family protein [Rhizobium sp. ERR1071]TWB15841.1 RimJ/RimL family protein N-acetyltransferase [Rhizobium sp. ERR1071]
MSSLILKGRNVRLRPPCAEDADVRFALGTNAEIAEMYGVNKEDIEPITREGATRWVQGLADQPHAWVIEIDGVFAGIIRLDNVNRQDRRATMAIGIYNPALLGKGFGTEAITLLLDHAFGEMRLHRIGIRVLAYNERAIRAYEKCGFIVEGRERETAYVNGRWHDDIMMGLLDREFSAPRL